MKTEHGDGGGGDGADGGDDAEGGHSAEDGDEETEDEGMDNAVE